jgi:prepilin peptidase CpaA
LAAFDHATPACSVLETVLHRIILLIGMGIFAIVAYGDMRTRRIPNELTIAIAILGLARMILAGDPGAALYTLAAGVAVFVIAFLLFLRGLFGGGDAKLLAATTLLIGYQELFDFLLAMSLCGALLALGVLVQNHLGRWLERLPLLMSWCGIPLRLTVRARAKLDRWVRHLPNPGTSSANGVEHQATAVRPSVPYGVAIAAAGVLILVLQSTVPG